MPSKPQRLFVKPQLIAKAEIALEPPQAHYLINVLRCKTGDEVLLFNGRDGEWRGALSAATKKRTAVVVEERTRPQSDGPDLHYLFAPLKRARVDYMAQKATEMGASLLQPVLTRRTMAERVNTSRLFANAVEAAEQCGILRVPGCGRAGETAAAAGALGRNAAPRLRRRGGCGQLAARRARKRTRAAARGPDRPGRRVRGGGEGAVAGAALRSADLARSPGDARRYRGRRRARAR